jgi:hypothetical protein
VSGLDLSGHDDDEPELDARTADTPEPAKPKRSRSRSRKSASPRPPRKQATEADLRKRIEEGLDEVIAFVGDRLEWDDVAATMRDDKKRMAEVLAARATKHARLGAALTRLFGKDSALSFARAFGPTLRALSSRLSAWRAERASGQPEEVLVDGDGFVIDQATGLRTGERVNAHGERVPVA